MKRFFSISALFLLFQIGFSSCSEKIDNTGTCNDGIRNQGEFGIDCGGPCDQVCPSCADGILNQGETGIDCGGPCGPCFPELKASVGSDPWNSTSRNASISGQGVLRIFGTDQLTSITLVYSGPFEQGVTYAGTSFVAEYRDGTGNLFTSTGNGMIEFISFDTTARTVSGAFQFEGVNAATSDKVKVGNGVFNMLSY